MPSFPFIAEGTSHLYVIAQRSSDDDRGGNHLQQPVEELKMELDNNCCILSVDTSKVKPPCYSKEEMISNTIYKYCHSTDRSEMRKYFEEGENKIGKYSFASTGLLQGIMKCVALHFQAFRVMRKGSTCFTGHGIENFFLINNHRVPRQ